MTLRDWAVEALEVCGLEPDDEEAIRKVMALALRESNGDPNYTGPNGEMGLLAITGAMWDSYNIGGSPYDPVANIVTSIRYQLARYGQLVDCSPHLLGGMSLAPHFLMFGEAGEEGEIPRRTINE